MKGEGGSLVATILASDAVASSYAKSVGELQKQKSNARPMRCDLVLYSSSGKAEQTKRHKKAASGLQGLVAREGEL